MKTPFRTTTDVLIDHLENQYGIRIHSLRFIPAGDSAYSYRLDCMNGDRYCLKIMDHQNERQKRSLIQLQIILPTISEMYHRGLFRNTAAPIKNRHGGFLTAFHDFSAVLFDFIEGETLADAYPLSTGNVRQIAESMAAIHLLAPEIDECMLPAETFDISFSSELESCLSSLENTTAFRRRAHQELRNHIMPRKEEIVNLLGLVRALRYEAIGNPKEKVLCHGDLWGGNLIRREDELYVIDWESAMIAPREYDMSGYIGDQFPEFIAAYETQTGLSVTIDLDLLRFYAHRHHLRNLTNWCMNILYRNTQQAQDENDLDMILYHCLNRWGGIEAHLSEAERIFQNEKRAPVRPLHPRTSRNP